MYFLKGFMLPLFFLSFVAIIFTFCCVFSLLFYVLWHIYQKLNEINSGLSVVFVFLCICCWCGIVYMLFSEGSAIHNFLTPLDNLLNSYYDFLFDYYPWLEDFLKAFSLADSG